MESSNIWEFIKLNTQWKEIPYRQQPIKTVEFGILSQKDVTQTLKEIMKAEPPKQHGSARRLQFSQDVLDRMKDIYDIDVEIEVDTESNGTHGTHGTLSEHVNDSCNQNYDTGNGHDKENYQEKDTENGNLEALDKPLHFNKVSQASQVFQNSQLYKCPYCEIMYHNSSIAYDNENALETHVVQKHPRWNAHSQPDIEKFRQEYLSRNGNGNGTEKVN